MGVDEFPWVALTICSRRLDRMWDNKPQPAAVARRRSPGSTSLG